MKRAASVAAMAAAMLLAGCSTVRRLSDDQTLYTGVKRMAVESVEQGAKVPGSVAAAVRTPLAVKPNNPLVSPWVRTPLPVGLWAYNSLHTDKKRGIEAWLYRMLAREPVVLEHDVQPEARVGMVRDILDNHGYFGSQAEYEIFHSRNPKKARVGYNVRVARPWHLATVRFPTANDPLTREIAALAEAGNLKPGTQYNVDTLARERTRMTAALRAKGYYYFRPEYIEYRADTTRVTRGVDLRMDVARGAPAAALAPYTIGEVRLRIFSVDGRGDADSVETGGVKVWYQRPLKLRHSIIRRAMTQRTGVNTGAVAALPAIDRVMDNLTRLGVFRYVNLETTALEELAPGDSLDMVVTAAMATPMEIMAEADLSYKSSSFMGPKFTLSTGHGNLFKGGEVLSLKLAGSYEWQTGGRTTGQNAISINSYEVGVNASLAFPRLLVPRFIGIRLNKRPGGKTSYTLGTNLLNRPKFFRMLTLNVSNTYEFRTSGTVSHSLTLFRLAYNNLLRTTPEFEQAMDDNRMIRQSFADQFVPSGSYTYTYDKRFGHLRRDRVVVQVSLTSAGNLWAGAYSLAGTRGGGEGSKKLLGSPFSQFFKETAEARLYKRVGRRATLAMRLFAGAGHAYGNSSVMPYTEQFSIGGANSLRAFTIRSIGPGSYHYTGEDDGYRYFDQTGEMKLEMNAEVRFPVAGGLHGAVFVDAGNIWLLRDDPSRPGGLIGNTRGGWRQVATGTGAGLRYDLSFLVLRLDLGVGLHVPWQTSRAGYYNIPRFRDGLGLHLAIGYPF